MEDDVRFHVSTMPLVGSMVDPLSAAFGVSAWQPGNIPELNSPISLDPRSSNKVRGWEHAFALCRHQVQIT